MPMIDPVRLEDRSRVAAAAWASEVLPALAIPLDKVAALAARLLDTPIAAVSMVSAEFDECLGAYGLPPPLTRHVPLRYSVCKYIISADRPVAVEDMHTVAELREHPSLEQFGVAAFAGVPLRDTGDQTVGALTVVDYVPRRWTSIHMDTLVEVAALLGPIPTAARPSRLSLLQQRGNPTAQAVIQAQVQQRFITALLDSLQVGVLAADTEGLPVLFNSALRRICGIDQDLPPPDATEAMIRDLYHHDGRPMTVEQTPLRRALAGESTRNQHIILHTPASQPKTLLTNSEPIRAPDGQPLGAVSTLMDVTEFLRVKQYRAAELQVATLLNKAHSLQEVAPALVSLIGSLAQSSHIGLWLVDPHADILRCAAHWTTPGTAISDLLPPHLTRHDPGPGHVWATGQPLTIPDLAHCPERLDGPGHQFARACVKHGLRTAVVLPLHTSEHVLGVLSCLSATPHAQTPHLTQLLDGIAEQISAHLARRRAAELTQQLAHAKDDFIALVGHAVRTPLTSISAFAELLGDDPDLPAHAQQMVRAVIRNAEVLRSIVAELLELAALETGESPLDTDDTDLAEIITDAVRAAQPAARSAHIDLTTTVPPRLPLHGDAARLRQLLDHLLDNAIKYSPQGRVTITAHRDGPLVELRVRDTGIGIPPPQRARVFDRFYRADNVAHSTTPGTGLGLSMVHAIAHAHHGSAHVADHDPPGTTIVVRIPATAPRSTQVDPQTTPVLAHSTPENRPQPQQPPGQPGGASHDPLADTPATDHSLDPRTT